MAINIPIAADSRQFIGATKDMAKGLDEVADSLDDVTRDSQKGTDRLEAGFKDVQRQTEKTEDSFKDLARTVERESKDAGRKIDSGIGDGLDKASAGMDDFKGEAASTAREGAASFTGEWDDVGDIVQETLANALGGFGPIGAAAGVALAAGFGALYAKVQADAEASEERVKTMYEGMIDSQGRYLSESSIMSGVDEIIQDQGRLTQAQETAAASGVDLGIVLRAMAGDAAATAEVNAELTKRQEEVQESADAAADANRDLTDTELKKQQAVAAATEAMGAAASEVDKASDKFDAYAAAARFANNEMQDAAATAAGLRKEIVKLPDGKTITLRVDDNISSLTSRFNTALTAMRRQASNGISVDYQLTKNGSKVY